jgi:hypothetical protein
MIGDKRLDLNSVIGLARGDNISFTHSIRILYVSLIYGMRYIRDGMDAGNYQDSYSADIPP